MVINWILKFGGWNNPVLLTLKSRIMKRLIKIYLLIFTATFFITNSCVENEYEMLDLAKSGFRVNMVADSYIEATYDLSTNTLEYDSVYFYIEFDIPQLSTQFSQLELHKILHDKEGNVVEDYIYNTLSPEDLPVKTLYESTLLEDLYEGFNFHKDSLKPDYTFEFKAIMKLADGSILEYRDGSHVNTPFLNGFCPLPVIPSGEWTAKNMNTQFSKTVTITTPSPHYLDGNGQVIDDGRFWLSDFGLDWSTWRDVWYSIEFKLNCPKGDDPRYVIQLLPGGVWNTGVPMTDFDHNGELATKDIRVMPYLYEDNSIVGYYDPEFQRISFENVPVIDSWWGIDNHTVNLTFTYKTN